MEVKSSEQEPRSDLENIVIYLRQTNKFPGLRGASESLDRSVTFKFPFSYKSLQYSVKTWSAEWLRIN